MFKPNRISSHPDMHVKKQGNIVNLVPLTYGQYVRMKRIGEFRYCQMRHTHLWCIEFHMPDINSGCVWVFSYRTMIARISYENFYNKCNIKMTEYFDTRNYNISNSTKRQLSWFLRIYRDTFDSYTEPSFVNEDLIAIEDAPYDPTKHGAYMNE